jgi:hypothetical protein
MSVSTLELIRRPPLQRAADKRAVLFAYVGALAFLMLVAGVLRMAGTNRPFIGQDQVLAPFFACYGPGYMWMISFYSTGGIIQLVAWVSAFILTSLGVAMTEFWWIAPIATVGTLQVPLTFVLALRLGCRNPLALAAAATMAVLPIHVMQSRLALAHEVLAVFWLSIATLALLHLFERPSFLRGLLASFCCGVYLVSHHYVIPFAVYFLAICALSAAPGEKSLLESIRSGVATFLRNGGPLFPLLAIPVIYHSLGYTFVHRPPQPKLDFRPLDFVATLYQSAGDFVATALLIAIPVGLARTVGRSRALPFCVLTAAAYMAPLFLSDAPDHHEVSQYSIIGIHFMVVAAALALNTLTPGRAVTLAFAAAGIALWVMTAAISVATVFVGLESSLTVNLPKGMMTRDNGVKAAGYFIRRDVSPAARILSLHEDLSRYAAVYYLRGGVADGLYALNGYADAATRAKLFHAFAEEADLIVVGRQLADMVEGDGRFEQALVVRCDGEPCVWIFSRPGIEGPRGVVEAADYNDDFDREYAPRSVSLLGRADPTIVPDAERRVHTFEVEALGEGASPASGHAPAQAPGR